MTEKKKWFEMEVEDFSGREENVKRLLPYWNVWIPAHGFFLLSRQALPKRRFPWRRGWGDNPGGGRTVHIPPTHRTQYMRKYNNSCAWKGRSAYILFAYNCRIRKKAEKDAHSSRRNRWSGNKYAEKQFHKKSVFFVILFIVQNDKNNKIVRLLIMYKIWI